ncbi:MAG: hypothetical protein BWY75_02557 [bacterium ADurb.Bin425]|nr:MAG: hypothetical protein BWY75_02557 [bacterium ADurb.Bin425]
MVEGSHRIERTVGTACFVAIAKSLLLGTDAGIFASIAAGHAEHAVEGFKSSAPQFVWAYLAALLSLNFMNFLNEFALRHYSIRLTQDVGFACFFAVSI